MKNEKGVVFPESRYINSKPDWNNKHGNVKENLSCASSVIHLLSIFEILGQKMEVLSSILYGTKITFVWITPIFRSNPPTTPIMPYPLINTYIFYP